MEIIFYPIDMSSNTTNDVTNKTEGSNVIDQSFDFKNHPGLVIVTVACGVTGIWMLFLTFYNSRLFAFVVTKLLRKFYLKEGYIEIGSLSFSILSGKFIFRDVKYITKDFSIQIVDGLAIIRWWFSYRPPAGNYYKEVLRDTDKLENGKCRLIVQLNGLECHLYNRSDLYDKIHGVLKCERYGDARKSTQSLDVLEENNLELADNGSMTVLRELFPVIGFNIRSGKLAIGNPLIERTFWIHFNRGNVTYSMPDAPCVLDQFTHFIHWKCDDVRMLLSKSPGYKGSLSDPPRWRGQDYTVLQSSEVKFTYYMDVPGFVPTEGIPESDPMWGLDIVFTKRVEINYGPWVDMQRDALQKYFLPNNFQEIAVTKPLEVEQRRLHTGFDVDIKFLEGASTELLFTRNEETVAFHFVCGNHNKGKEEKPKSSSVHFYQPWIVNEYGYTTNITARLQEVEATTSLEFQNFLESDTVEVDLNMTIPRIWNQFQHWTCDVTLAKTTCYFLWQHVDYISDLLKEWSVNMPEDISKFVPYEWEFNFYLRDFELIVLVNQYNWVHCTKEEENNELALCGESLDINFLIPFTHFQADKSEMKFFFQGETMMLRTFIPESNTLRRSVIALMKHSDQKMYPKYATRESTMSDSERVDGNDAYDEVDSGVKPEDQLSKGWRNRTKGGGWVDIWSVPVMILNLYYTFTPVPVQNEMTERINKQCGIEHTAREPLQLSPDKFTIELEAGPSALRLLGFFWRQFFLGFKGNYFGLFQEFSEFNVNRDLSKELRRSSVKSNVTDPGSVDMRNYRPLEVNLTIVLLDIQAELSMHSTCESSPRAFTDRLTFEMHKTYQETRLQLILSPITIVMQDNVKRGSYSAHLSKGFLTLSGLQFRGDAMFSDKEVSLGNDTIEYAWLVEVQCGQLTGKCTPSHVQSLVTFAETFLLHLTDVENQFLTPDPLIKCHHAIHQNECPKTLTRGFACPTEDSVKYKMVRVSVESVNVFLAEAECVCNVQASPVRFATCNSRNNDVIDGSSVFINECCIRQYVQQVNLDYVEDMKPSCYTTSYSNNWIEVGVVGLGPITVDIQAFCMDALSCEQQLEFLLLHDARTKRLWFIWNKDELNSKLAVDRRKLQICGCVGGCNFFGNNANGVHFFTNQPLDASNGKHNRYGSESLWGGMSAEIGNSVKEHLLRRSASMMNSMGKISTGREASRSSKGFSSNMDTVDTCGRSMSFVQRRDSSMGEIKDNESKLAFGRSRSLIDGGSIKLNELRSMESDSTFYSCRSDEAELEPTPKPMSRKNRYNSRPSRTSRTSLKSNGSSDSYVSAVSFNDTNDDDVEDGPSLADKPFVDPALLSAYKNHMQDVTCMNWRQNVPSLRKKFSLLKNLKSVYPGHKFAQPCIPNFSPGLYGKLPFSIITSSHNLKEAIQTTHTGEEERNREDVRNETGTNKLITLKFHQKVSVIATPLVLKVLERFIDSLTPISHSYHLCHVLDNLHDRCISLSKQKYRDQALTSIISKQCQTASEQLSEQTDSEKIGVSALIPEIKILFLQVSGERYVPSEHSSLSAKCGSQLSYDFDAKNANVALFAALLTNINVKVFAKTHDTSLFRAAAKIVYKHNDGNSTVPEYVLQNIRDQKISNLCVVNSGMEAISMQLLHLEGASNKENRLTSIPRQKSKVQFSTKRGGYLFTDGLSTLDSPKLEDLGNIIFEAGIENILITGQCSSTLNLDTKKATNKDTPDTVEKGTSKASTSKASSKAASVHTQHEDVASNTSSQKYFKEDAADRIERSNFPNFQPTRGDYVPLDNSTSSISSDGSYMMKPCTRKGYIALDIDSGEIADLSEADSDHDDDDDEDEKVSLLSGSDHNKGSSSLGSKQQVHYKKRSSKRRSTKRKSSLFKDVSIVQEPVIVTNANGDVSVGKVWVNLAAPTRLQMCNNESEQDINLVMVLVPALSCWISPAYELLTSIELLKSQIQLWNYSVLAAVMGQALPDHGKLLKKNVIAPAKTHLAHFLQEESSSQLINIIRRQTTVNHRLSNLHNSLDSNSFTPTKELLEKGIFALARQWKTVLVGAEGVENIFATSYQVPKKPVVGRGDLPPDALKFLLKEARTSDSRIYRQEDIELGLMKSQKVDQSVDDIQNEHLEADILLTSSSEDSGDDEPPKEVTKPEQTLYDWMLKSPATTSVLQSPAKDASDHRDNINTDVIQDKEKDRSRELNILRSDVPMVSVPTSGMQLADTANVFNVILASVGMKDMNEDVKFLTQYVVRGNASLDQFQVTLLAANTSNKSNTAKKIEEKSEPTFVLNKFALLLNRTERPSVVDAKKRLSNDVMFSVTVENVHQKVDFALVRLILQMRETLQVLQEEDQFATKYKNDRTNRADWNHTSRSPMSSPENIRAKSWKNMYNVMTLYTTDSTKPSGTASPALKHQIQYIRDGKTLLSVREESIDLSAGVSHKESVTVVAVDDECGHIERSVSITGTACLAKARVIASISGLKLMFELKNINSSFHKSKSTTHVSNTKKPDFKNSAVISIHLDRLKINLIESIKALRKVPPTRLSTDNLLTDDETTDRPLPGSVQPELRISRTLLTCKVYRSHALHTNLNKIQTDEKSQHSSLLAIGPVAVDIPQHPGALRSTVTQFSKRLQKHFLEFDDYRMSRKDRSHDLSYSENMDAGSVKDSLSSFSKTASFRVTSNSIVMSAALLPSLRVEYKIEQIHVWGNFSSKARFFCSLPYHVLSFNTKVHVVPLPTTTHIDLPPIKVEGYYLEIHNNVGADILPIHQQRDHHGYLGVSIDVGNLEQNLTTDLLNHMIFFQKGFVKEINEVVEVVETTEQVPLRRPKSSIDIDEPDGRKIVPMIYSIKIKLQGIQITATTPSCTGIRLKTGELSMEVTNQNPASSVLSIPHQPLKVYGHVLVDINIALGHFNKNTFASCDNDITVYANFETSLGVSNILKEIKEEQMDKETILVTLNKPQLFVMPAAADKGVLVYLHYKNAYENWMEQRLILKSEFPAVAEHILNRIPQQPSAELSSYLILQVDVQNLGACLPLKDTPTPASGLNNSVHNSFADTEAGPALIVTVEEASVMCCSSGSFVSTGHFNRFCLRFSDNFDHMSETWSIEEADIMNTYTIPEGSYELCSRTIMSEIQDEFKPGKWVMSLFWKMRDGVDIHIDANIGKRLKSLTNALTALTGDSDVADMSSVTGDFDVLLNEEKTDGDKTGDTKDSVDGAVMKHVLLNDENTLERQLLVQTKKVNQLRRNSANAELIGREVKQLQDIENALSKEFFKDVKKRFRRRARRSTMDTGFRRKRTLNDINASSKNFLDPRYDPIRSSSFSASNHKRTDDTKDLDFIDGPMALSPPIKNVEESNAFLFPDASRKTRSPQQVTFVDTRNDFQYGISAESKVPQQVHGTEALNFEFNMVIDIKSGKCTLHSKVNEDGFRDVTDSKNNASKKHSDQTDAQPRQNSHRALRQVRSAGTNFPPSSSNLTPNDSTVLLIPGVKVRLYYLSKFTLDSPKNSDMKDTASSTSRPILSKSGTLNASIGIQSLSREMIVTPSILDFLEKAIEPIMTKSSDADVPVEDESMAGTGSMLSSSGSGLYSFPVDVVVLIRVQPSDIRFNCSPISKVECLLRIPSLDFAITSTPPISSNSLHRRRNSSKQTASNTSNISSGSGQETSEITSGMGFTVCLSRFSFCVFHPYGKHYGNIGDSRSSGSFAEQRRNSRSRNQPISGKKDSLSLNVEFIKFNLSRKTCKSIDDQRTSVQISALCDIGSAAFNYDMRRLTEILDVPKAWYKRSLMQRLFLGKEGVYAAQTLMNQSTKSAPNATPATTIQVAEQDNSELRSAQKTTHTRKQSSETPRRNPVLTHRRGVSSGTSFLSNLITSPFPGRSESMHLFVDSGGKRDSSSSLSDDGFDETDGPSNSGLNNASEWETKVVVAFNVTRVDVSTNLGNIMGQAVWSTNDLRTNASVCLNNIGVSTAAFNLAVRQGSIDAHGGVVGGYLELHDISADGKFIENFGETPLHSAVVGMKNGEVRLDYMGSSILMASLSSLYCKFEDHWLIPEHLSTQNDDSSESVFSGASVTTPPHEFKSCEIYLNCDAHWDEVQIIISRSTATDFGKMMIKLEDFFDQQHRSGIRALNTLHNSQRAAPGSGQPKSDFYSQTMPMASLDEDEMSGDEKKVLKYQHWIELLNALYGLQLNNFPARIPDKNVVLGGRLSLSGNFASLACFHGTNFRTQNWGLFTVREPALQFTSETRVVEKSCQVMRAACVHDVTLSLGKSEENKMSERRKSTVNMHNFMATVRKVSRGRRNPPVLGAPVQDWLMFVSTTSGDDMPFKSNKTEDEAQEKFSHTKSSGGSKKVSFAPKFRYENESEVIFALPPMRIQLTTEHDQPMSTVISKTFLRHGKTRPMKTFPVVPSPHLVDMSFLSTFEEAIHVTMDVSLLFYLHDLILSYMKEQESSLTVSASRLNRSQLNDNTDNAVETSLTKTETSVKKEERYREFHVKNWKLDPRISLLSWAGKRMDPVSIDWVLERLGFTHAKMTIPKWIQRGALDPMDYTLAVIMAHLLVNMKVNEDDVS